MFQRNSLKWKIIWPTVVVITLVLVGMASYIYKQTANSLQLQGLAITETVRLSIENALTARKTVEEVLEKEMIGQASMASLLIKKGTSYSELVELAKKSGIDEFWISDANGCVELTSVAPDVDFDYSADPNGQAYEFMNLITGKNKVIAQPAQTRTIDTKVFKYVGVPGWDSPRIIQVGREGTMLTALDTQIGPHSLIAKIKGQLSNEILFSAVVSPDGAVLVGSDEEIQSIDQLSTELKKQLSETLTSKQITSLSHSFAGKKTTYYLADLSNGNSLLLAVSNEILTDIRNITIFATVIALIILTSVLFFVVNRQIKRLEKLNEALALISEGEGDLTKQINIESNDEIGELSRYFNKFLEKLRNIIENITQNADITAENANTLAVAAKETTSSISEVSKAVEELATGASEQASEASKSSEKLILFGSEINLMNQAVQNAKKHSDHMNQLSQEGLKTFNYLSDKFSQNTEINQQVTNNVEQLAEKSTSINQIVNAIQSVADQTNLLALNAAIEAARAGESGRGFAVVADEIRKLAEQTAVSTKEIETIINEIQKEISTTKNNMDHANALGSESQAAVKETIEGFNQIMQAIEETIAEIDDLIQSVQKVDSEKDVVIENIQGIAAIAQQSAASTEEVSASVEEQTATIETMAQTVEELKKIANLLKNEVNKFKI